jgi:hypothetical protein
MHGHVGYVVLLKFIELLLVTNVQKEKPLQANGLPRFRCLVRAFASMTGSF